MLIDSKRPYVDSLDRHVHEINSDALIEWSVKVRNLLSKAYGQNSEHYRSFVENENLQAYDLYLDVLMRLRAVFLVAKEDFEGGYLNAVRTLVQAEVFDSELEQAKA